MATINITQIRHPEYRESQQEWRKWRLAYEGGRAFVNTYLKTFPKREPADEFRTRKELTYCTRFAGAAIDDVKNSIFQRMPDINRAGGGKTYMEAVKGLNGGVDLDGSTMDRFLGQYVLPEMLNMTKAGVYIDMPPVDGPTIADAYGKRPYLYYYCIEDIASWCGSYRNNRMEYTSLLLRDHDTVYEDTTGLPNGTKTSWTLYTLTPEGVEVENYDGAGKIINAKILPKMKRIPFVLFEVPKSLMEDIADYQIALMNLESTDIDYMRRSNFPFYTEQYDPRADNQYARPGPDQVADSPQDLKRKEVVIGSSSGRRYPLGANPPEFIHPSPEPLMASMQKEQQIKNDIRKLLNLSLSNLEPKFASAESKGMDDRSLESGLAAIGQILEHGERQIAEIWADYIQETAAQIIYPKTYSLKSDAERREEAKSDAALMTTVPSITYQKEIAKKIARTMVSHLVTTEVLAKITKEVDDAGYMSSISADITEDLTNGLVSTKTASRARGYKEGEAELAKVDQAERLARIQAAQTPPGGNPDNPGARGLKDANPVPGNPNPDNTQRQ